MSKTEEVLLDPLVSEAKLVVKTGNKGEFIGYVSVDGDQIVRVTGKSLKEVLIKVEDTCSLIVGD